MYPRLRHLREDKDLSQAQVAAILNISQTTYSRYESGILDLPSLSLIRLADFHNTTTDYLLGRTDIKDPLPKGK